MSSDEDASTRGLELVLAGDQTDPSADEKKKKKKKKKVLRRRKIVKPLKLSKDLEKIYGRPVMSPRLLHSDALRMTSGKSKTKEIRKKVAKAQLASRNDVDQLDPAYAWENDSTLDILLSEQDKPTQIPDVIQELKEEEDGTEPIESRSVQEKATIAESQGENQGVGLVVEKSKTLKALKKNLKTKELGALYGLGKSTRRKQVQQQKSMKRSVTTPQLANHLTLERMEEILETRAEREKLKRKQQALIAQQKLSQLHKLIAFTEKEYFETIRNSPKGSRPKDNSGGAGEKSVERDERVEAVQNKTKAKKKSPQKQVELSVLANLPKTAARQGSTTPKKQFLDQLLHPVLEGRKRAPVDRI